MIVRRNVALPLFLAAVLTSGLNTWVGASSIQSFDTGINIADDQESVRQGAHLVLANCRMCHEFKYVTYKNLIDIGVSKGEVDLYRGEADAFQGISSLLSEKDAKDIFGTVPPELSLIAKARKHGPAYVYALLTGYHKTDAGIENGVFPGVSMPDVLGKSVNKNEAVLAKIDEQAKQVAAFLRWAADPSAQTRRKFGAYVIAYLVVLTFLLYLIKRRTWARLPD